MNATILCAEDVDVVRLLLMHLLRSAGHTAISAANGKEALELIDNTVDCLVTDIIMPEVNGFELIETLRADPRYAGLPIIVLTAHTEPELQREAEALGANYVIEKPCDPEVLLTAVDNAVAHRRTAVASDEPDIAQPVAV